jgi:hypothetical protein
MKLWSLKCFLLSATALCSFDCGGQTTNKQPTGPITDAQLTAICGDEADARKSCLGDYDTSASRDEYVTSCIRDLKDHSNLDLVDPASFESLARCEAEGFCHPDKNCEGDVFAARANANPELAGKIQSCEAQIRACYPSADPESLDSSTRSCLAFAVANQSGLAILDACLKQDCHSIVACVKQVIN